MNKKIVLKISLYLLIAFISIYVIISIWISFSLNSLINSANKNNGQLPDKYKYCISADNYSILAYKWNGGYELKGKKVKETDFKTFPIVIHNFVSAKAYYMYSYEVTTEVKNDGYGSNRIPVCVTYELKNFRWVVTDCSEPV